MNIEQLQKETIFEKSIQLYSLMNLVYFAIVHFEIWRVFVCGFFLNN